MRIFNVLDERLGSHGNETESVQDFFFNNAPMIELTDIDTCLEIMQLREKYFDNPKGLSLALKTRKDMIKVVYERSQEKRDELNAIHSKIVNDTDEIP